MEQKTLQGADTTTFTKSTDLADILTAEVVEETREVILRASSCCGCGCSDVKIKRVVPHDSKLKDGDYVGSDIQRDDEIIEYI